MEYEVIRSNRRTMSLTVGHDGQVVVRAPLFTKESTIRAFVGSHEAWIAKAKARAKARQDRFPPLTPEETKRLRRAAADYLPKRVAYYSELTGLNAAHVTITGAQTRFGSCSADNRLSFSLHLMRHSAAFIDYVVLHELAHTVHHDHSAAFYELIARYMPDYRAVIKADREGR